MKYTYIRTFTNFIHRGPFKKAIKGQAKVFLLIYERESPKVAKDAFSCSLPYGLKIT